jgi:uncharacterized protein YlzI (FlbEa/FlbD family)
MKMTGVKFKRLYVKDNKILPNNVTEITGSLYLDNNNISKIENLPHTITGSLFLSHNKIEKIENLPDVIDSYLDLSYNKIKKIENLPNIINGDLDLHGNPVFSQYKKSNFTDQKVWAYMIMKLDVWNNL